MRNALMIISIFLIGCTESNKFGVKSSSSGEQSTRKATIQLTEGINVNESDAIWVTGMKDYDSEKNTRLVKVHRIELNSEAGYPVKTWSLVLNNSLGSSGSGIRTYVTTEGLLFAKASGGNAALYLAHKDTGIQQLWVGSGYASSTRMTPYSYRIFKNNRYYEYMGGCLAKAAGEAHCVRFLKQGNDWVQVRSYRMNHSGIIAVGYYTGFLDKCSTQENNQCIPLFYGGRRNQFVGIRMDADVPGSPYQAGQFIQVPGFLSPNENFQSASHPQGGPIGTVNNDVYSLAGDEDGNLLRAHFPDTSSGNNFISYDKVNQLVFHTHRNSGLLPDGNISTEKRSIVAVYDKTCFSSDPNCGSAQSQAKWKIFRDVGEELGPTSDLGNGCVAMMSFKRPGEQGGDNFYTKVYKVCPRDGTDISKGMAVTLLADVEGAAYMYNDFTGATLYDRPTYFLFDFSKKRINQVNQAFYTWLPKPGFSNQIVGIKAQYRCYTKGSAPSGDQGFKNFQLGVAYSKHGLTGCKGNMVEFKLEIDSSQRKRFTRFGQFNVSVEGA